MTMIRIIRRPAFVLGCLLALTAAMPSRDARLRHVRLKKSVPAANDTLTASPKSLQFWFSEKVDLKTTDIKLATGAAVAVSLGAATRDDSMGNMEMPVVTEVTRPLAPGAYVISWAAVADDGEHSKGTVKFVVKASH